MAAPDAWRQLAYVAIAKQAGSDVEFRSKIETIDISIGDRPIEGIALINGGRITKFNPEEDTEITLECYHAEAGTDTGTTGEGWFDLFYNTTDTAQALRLTNATVEPQKLRVAILWTDDTTQTSAASQVVSGKAALRIVAADGYLTSVKPSFTDGILKFAVTFKIPPRDASANACVLIESLDASATTMTALQSYTSSVKF